LRERFLLLLYLGAVVSLTLFHDLPLLLAALALVSIIAGRAFPRIARRALVAILLFNSVVTVSHAAVALFRHEFRLDYVLLINVRVFLLTFLTFLVVERVDLIRALSFSPTLTCLVSLAYGQILSFRRLFEEFRLALRSRTIARLTASQILGHGGATGAWFLRRSLRNSEETAQAMKSRGFFHA